MKVKFTFEEILSKQQQKIKFQFLPVSIYQAKAYELTFFSANAAK